MQPAVYQMTKGKRAILIAMAAFFYLGVLMFGAILFSKEAVEPTTIKIVLVIMIGSFIFATYFLLFALLSRLYITPDGIGYQKFLAVKFYPWQAFYYIQNTPQLLHLYFKRPGFDPGTKVVNALFDQPNIIPISNFVKEWRTEKAWQTDPLLHTLDTVFELSKETESMENSEDTTNAVEENESES